MRSMQRPRVVDIHCHFYPQEYLHELASGRGAVSAQWSQGGEAIIHYAGDYNVVVPAHWDPEVRLQEMDREGVDLHVLSLTTPGVHIEEAQRGRDLARLVNSCFLELCRKFPDRFAALAAIPWQDPNAAADELRWAAKEGLAGVMLFSNINGNYPDHPDIAGVLQEAARLKMPVFLHPATPPDPAPYEVHRLVPLLGFPFDTTLAVVRLLFSGSWPANLRLIVAHLGGTIPYLAERLDRGWRAYGELYPKSRTMPSSLLAQLYYDTVNFAPEALRLALDFCGSQRLLFGSDYPHQIGSMAGALRAVHQLALLPTQRRQVLGENALHLLRMSLH